MSHSSGLGNYRRVLVSLVAGAVAFGCSLAVSLDLAPPHELGLSAQKLEAISRYVERQVDERRIAGAVVAVARHGRIGYLRALGQQDIEAARPMQADTLFRIASMSKAITSAGVMMLVEDGQLALDDPVSKYLPELKSPRMLLSVDGPSLKTVAVNSSPTIHQLLTHTAGYTYGWFGPDKLDGLYRERRISDLFVPTDETMAQRVRRLGSVPLKFQPGSAWDYSFSLDVLGRVVEVVSGLTLDKFFYERFFRPLEMHDTHFHVPLDKLDRLASLYTPDERQRVRKVGSDPVTAGFVRMSDDYCVAGKGQLHSGGAGLVSTAGDYLRLLQMLLNGGELDGRRILQRETVARMTSNQIGDLRIPFPGHGDGFGYGFGVLTQRGSSEEVASVGTYSWGGLFNTYFWVDPSQQMIGLLMTQVFPYDHLAVREQVKRMAYDAVDDSGFERVYWFQAGQAHANPYLNARQLRVNAPDVSVHSRFAQRSEARSSGMARILIDEDLRAVRRASLYCELWGGHPGTENKRVSVNGRSHYSFPQVGTEQGNCAHQYHSFNLRLTDLVNGHNSLQFACDTGSTFWGHYIVDNAALRMGLARGDAALTDAGLSEFSANVSVAARADGGEGFVLRLEASAEGFQKVSRVHFQARYHGYDENGNALANDWHGMTKAREPYGHVASTQAVSEGVVWDTSMLPAQQRVAVRAIVEFQAMPDIVYQTPITDDVSIPERPGEQVAIIHSDDIPRPFWSRAGRRRECTLWLDVEPNRIRQAELHVVAWTGGAGEVRDYFTFNGHPLKVAEGNRHEVVYSRVPIDAGMLRRGENRMELVSDTEHHGIEILLPGPALVIRARDPRVTLFEDAVDLSADNLPCYQIVTPAATYYLDKQGGGIASLLDRDGRDWIGFHPRPGSGPAGEYRGFPNAVFREAGSYFHPKNTATDACETRVELVTESSVIISARAPDGMWAGQYEFTDRYCRFTMTSMPTGRKYWVLYEGTPGGQYDDSDWWMTSADAKRHALTETQDTDLAAPEWIAFGDASLQRVLWLLHETDDSHPDRFYQMERQMTVFGFGRDGMRKFLDEVPRSFMLGLLETTDHAGISREIETFLAERADQRRKTYEALALRRPGDAARGRQLFHDANRGKCVVCHKVDQTGGDIGPDLSRIGGKFDRPHLIESLLRPSRQIVEGFRASAIATSDGRVRVGIVKSEQAEQLTLVDANAVKHVIARSDIEERREVAQSLMPDGLDGLLAPDEFVDVIAYLETLRPGGKPKFGEGVVGPIHLRPGFEIETVATNLTGATSLETLADGRVFICEQTGALRVVKNGQLLEQPFLTLSVDDTWERGLLGVTVHPDYPDTPHVFVCYVARQPYPHHRVSRFTAEGDRAIPGSEQILLEGDDQTKFGGNVPAGHQGGGIHFGLDGKIYVGLGEQTASTPSQDLRALQGKILRLSDDGSIPDDNPFWSNTSGKYRSIWALGLRNPFTFAVEPAGGDLFVNDVGGQFEEINRVTQGGMNFGWPTIEHGPTDAAEFVGPIHYYPQASISGGDFAPSDAGWPAELSGRYFFADFVHGWIKVLDPADPAHAADFASGLRRPVDLRFAVDGSLYVLLRNAWVIDDKFESGTGTLLRIFRSGSAGVRLPRNR